MSDRFSISVIMQSYLGEYPNSRLNPERKFIRAVDSFLNQTDKNNELIIVSDGCDITHRLFHNNYINENRIKYVYVHNGTGRMYQHNDGKVLFRGLPREVGRSVVNNEIVTYMDSDDFLIPDYLEILINYWNENRELDWVLNKAWYDNFEMKYRPTFGYDEVYKPLNDVIEEKIEGLDSLWVPSEVKDGLIVKSPALFSHKNNCIIKWKDVISGGDVSEDGYFIKQFLDKYEKGGLIRLLGYVRCHLKCKWDW